MSNVKCNNCGLYNFAGVTECRRCTRSLSPQPVPQTTSYASHSPMVENSSPYAATHIQVETAFPPPGSWMPVADETVDNSFEDREPFFFLLGFLLIAMAISTGIPPDIKNLMPGLAVFHIGIFFFMLYGVGKWLVKLHQTGSQQKYSGKIRGFLVFPATGMIIHCLVTLWMFIECRSAADQLSNAIETDKNMNTGYSRLRGFHSQEETLNQVKDFLDLATPVLLVMSILFVIALIFFYQKHKQTPFICTMTLFLYIAGFIFIDYRSRAMVKSLPESVRNKDFNSLQASDQDLLLWIGGLCMLINFVAFIIYFMISRRVRATFGGSQSLYSQAVPQTTSYASHSPMVENSSPYVATHIQVETAFPTPKSQTPVTDNTVGDIINSLPKYAPAFLLAVLLVAAIIASTGIPPKLEKVQLSLSILHMAIVLFILFGLGKWVISLYQAEVEKKYSGEIEGFLTLPAAGMIAYSLLTFWMAGVCWFVAGPLPQERGASQKRSSSIYKLLTGGRKYGSLAEQLRDFSELSSFCLLFISILFVIALIFFYRKYKRAPVICTLALLLNILGFFLITLRSHELESRIWSTFSHKSFDSSSLSEYGLFVTIGNCCILFNFVAFILYFLLSRRVKATFERRLFGTR